MAAVLPFARKQAQQGPQAPAQGTQQPAGAKTPSLTGEALCNGCQHKWQAVVPVPVGDDKTERWGDLECPACGAFKGNLTQHVVYDNDNGKRAHWTCVHCTGMLFSLHIHQDDGIPILSCANCGNRCQAIHAFPTR